MARPSLKTEDLDEVKIRQVIWMLKEKPGKKPTTKKECCEHLGIAYNTKRLDKIIEEFQNREKREKELREKAKKKVFSDSEKKSIANDYINGQPVSQIARNYYVTDYRIKKILKELQVPLRGRGKNKPAKVEHIVQDFDRKLKVGDKVLHVPTSATCIVKTVYDEDYAEFLSNPVAERFVKLHKPKYIAAKDKWDDREDVHYNVYWQYENHYEMKRWAVQNLVNSIYDNIEKNGRETYLLMQTGENHRFIQAKRESVLPVEIK